MTHEDQAAVTHPLLLLKQNEISYEIVGLRFGDRRLWCHTSYRDTSAADSLGSCISHCSIDSKSEGARVGQGGPGGNMEVLEMVKVVLHEKDDQVGLAQRHHSIHIPH